jgi:hypothetical protein
MDTEERDYLWQHFAFNAEQRLKAFNFFVVFSVFANGGAFAAADKSANGAVFILIGGFVAALLAVFFIIDTRSQNLLQLAVPGLKEYEKRFAEHSRLFARDAAERSSVLRYTVAFRVLFGLQLFFGVGTIVYGLTKWV